MWVAALVAAPVAAAHGTASPFVLAIYETCGLLCHQRPERSFHLSGLPLPVCARCFGLYASAAAGAIVGWVVAYDRHSRMSSRFVRIALAAASLPTLMTVAAEWLGVLHLSSSARAIAAVPLGAAVGVILVALLRAEPPCVMMHRRDGDEIHSS